MKHLIRRPLLRRTLFSPKTLLHQLQQKPLDLLNPSISSCRSQPQTRSFISEMRKSAFKDHILRLLRNETQYELDRLPPKQPVTKFGSFLVDDLPGKKWVSLKRKFAENEEIKVEATMFDGAISVPKSASAATREDVQLHITLVVNISKGDDNILEIMCSAWPDSIEITNLFFRRSGKMSTKPYVGPDFKELDDELQDSLYDYLEARGIDDEMAVFLHEYMKNKDRAELIRWLGTVKSYIEK